jgi:putative transposase
MTLSLVPMRLLSYCVMPNHWHLLLWPRSDHDLAEFMHRLTTTHVRRWHRFRQSDGLGHLYQGTYKSFPIQEDRHFLTVARYVERNPLRAKLVTRAQDWQWGSLWRRERGSSHDRGILSQWPLAPTTDWTNWVNRPQSEKELAELRDSIQRSRPFGDASWQTITAKQLKLESSLRPRGRPKLLPES